MPAMPAIAESVPQKIPKLKIASPIRAVVPKPKAAAKKAVKEAVAKLTRDINPCDELKASIARPGTSQWAEAQKRLKDDVFICNNKLSYPSAPDAMDSKSIARIGQIIDTRSFLGYVLGENTSNMRWRFANSVATTLTDGIEVLCNVADAVAGAAVADSAYDFYFQFGYTMYDELSDTQRHSIRAQYSHWKDSMTKLGLL
jgi:hypothetical protein